MLRITSSTKDGTAWLRLEGKLVGPWVDECRGACARARAHGRGVALDLAAVTFVDADGVRLLRQLVDQGTDIPVRSNFVTELLRLERS